MRKRIIFKDHKPSFPLTHSGRFITSDRKGIPFYLFKKRALVPLRHATRLRTRKSNLVKSVDDPESPFYGITSSDLGSYSKVFRLKNYLLGRANSLIKYYHLTFDGIEVVNFTMYNNLLMEVDLIRRWAYRLDSNSVVSHKGYALCFQFSKSFPKSFEDHATRLFGYYKKPPKKIYDESSLESQYLKYMSKNSKLGRKAELLARLSMECKDKQDWFYVFNSLTVRPGAEELVFSRGAKVWSNYILKCDRLFGQAAYGTVRESLKERKKGNEFHTYFAVVERGSKHGRLHIHVLHVFKTLPQSFSDPNYGIFRAPINREINCLKSIWLHGFSSPIAVRFNSNDAYAKKGWRWPVRDIEGKLIPCKVSVPDAIIFYIGKYLNKSYSSEGETWTNSITKTKATLWRTRLSRNLGRKIPQTMVNQMSKFECKVIISEKYLPLQNEVRMPKMMMRKMILNRYLKGLIRLATVSLTRYHLAYGSVKTPLERLRNMIAIHLHPKKPNFGTMKIKNTLRMVAFKRIYERHKNYFQTFGASPYGIRGANLQQY